MRILVKSERAFSGVWSFCFSFNFKFLGNLFKGPPHWLTQMKHKHPPAVQAALSLCWQNTRMAALKSDSWECVTVNKSMGCAKPNMIWKSFLEKMSGPTSWALVSSSSRCTAGMSVWICQHCEDGKITTLSCSLLMFSCLFTDIYLFLTERG